MTRKRIFNFIFTTHKISRWFRSDSAKQERALSSSFAGETCVDKPAEATEKLQRSASLPVNPRLGSACTMKMHVKARELMYPRSDVKRFHVPDDKVPWAVPCPEYAPVEFTAKAVLEMPPWADVDPRYTVTNGEQNTQGVMLWNSLDGKINRRSHMGVYEVVDQVPRNPVGRTGISGRGCLGKWGPNHAADPIVTRWKRNENGDVIKDDEGRPVLQFVAVQRKDNGEWAIPGGMVDAGEVVTITLRREFMEEAMNSLEALPKEKKAIEKSIDELFANGKEVYRGYVDDPRNTDNAWMETVALNFHDTSGTSVAKCKLHAGDDAAGVKWMDLSRNLKLYASHYDFLQKTAEKHKASW